MLSISDSSSPDGTRIVPFSVFKTFVNPKVVPVDMHLPEHTLPFELSRQLSHSDLFRVFGWKELSLLDWLSHLTSPPISGKSASVETNLLASPAFAEKVLAVLAKGWQQVPSVAQRNIVELVAKLACIPTKHGLKQPSESYFPNVSLFEDLAVVTLPSGAAIKGNIERLLAAFGVRRHVEVSFALPSSICSSSLSVFSFNWSSPGSWAPAIGRTSSSSATSSRCAPPSHRRSKIASARPPSCRERARQRSSSRLAPTASS